MDFEWDAVKAQENARAHRIRFADTPPVFDDPFAMRFQDEHPDEERFLILGMDAIGRTLVVSYT